MLCTIYGILGTFEKGLETGQQPRTNSTAHKSDSTNWENTEMTKLMRGLANLQLLIPTKWQIP